MQFSTLFFAAAAATLASAVKLTNSNFDVTAGTPFNITWADAEGPVTLTLKNGPSTSLSTVSTIGSGLTGTSFSWTPSATLDSSLYAIEIEDSTATPNYSVQFQVSGATAIASTVTASSTSASSSGSSTSDSSSASSTGSSSASTSSASTSSTVGRNSTTTANSSSTASKTSSLTTSASQTGSSTSSSSTGTSTSAPTSAAAEFASPLAFVFLAFAAIVTLN